MVSSRTFVVLAILLSSMLVLSSVHGPVQPAQAEEPPGPVFWEVGNLTVVWGTNAVNSGLVDFLVNNTPVRTRLIHQAAQAELQASGSSEWEQTQALWATQNYTELGVSQLISWLADDSPKNLVKDLYTESTGKSWISNSQRTYKRGTLPLNPVFKGVEALYASVGIEMDANKQAELTTSISYLSPLAQELLAVLIFAVADAHKEGQKAFQAGTPPLDVLARDGWVVLDALDKVRFEEVPGEDHLFFDIPSSHVASVELAVANLTTYKSIRTAQAAIFMLEAINEVQADLQTLSPPLARPSNTPQCSYQGDSIPLFIDPMCLIVFEPFNALEWNCASTEVPVAVLIVASPQRDRYYCPVAGTVDGATLLLDLGGDNLYHWMKVDAASTRAGWAYGGAFGGAAVLWDQSACSDFSGRRLAGGFGTGYLGTALLVAGHDGSCVGSRRMNVIGEGSIQGVGHILGIGVLDYVGAEPLHLKRYGFGNRCISEGFDDYCLLGNPGGDGILDIKWGRQGSGVGVLGAGIVRSSSPATVIQNLWGPDGMCIADYDHLEIVGYAHSAMTGIGVGHAGLGIVITQNDGGSVATGTAACKTGPDEFIIDPFTLSQGVGSMFGLGVVSGKGHGEIDRAIGANGAPDPRHAFGLGGGYVAGVGAVLDSSYGARYRVCQGSGSPEGSTGVLTCADANSEEMHGGGLGAAFGIGYFRNDGIGEGGNNTYWCTPGRTECWGGLPMWTNDQGLCWFDPMFCGIMYGFNTVHALGFFVDEQGVDAYVGSASGTQNDRFGLIRGVETLYVNGFFSDCSSASCTFSEEGFWQ